MLCCFLISDMGMRSYGCESASRPYQLSGTLTSLDLGHLFPPRTCGSGAEGMFPQSPMMLESWSLSPAVETADAELDMTVGFLTASCFWPFESQALKEIWRAAAASSCPLRIVVAVDTLPVVLPALCSLMRSDMSGDALFRPLR